MKIYDCFLFNDELNLLRLRLEFLKDSVDYFVLVESERTLSGEKKTLHFKENQEQFADFTSRIIHIVAPNNDMPPWEYEFFQRNYIKSGLQNCDENDIIIISDADEIVNIKEILSLPDIQLPALPEIPVYYYFFNLKSNVNFRVNLIAHWKFIKDKDISNRVELFSSYANTIIHESRISTGWHFSYLYGNDTELYRKKINSFSHQEYNNDYYTDSSRIRRCVESGIDLYERLFMKFKKDDVGISPLLPLIKKLSLDHLLYNRSFISRLSPANISFIFKKIYLKKIKTKFQRTKNIL